MRISSFDFRGTILDSEVICVFGSCIVKVKNGRNFHIRVCGRFYVADVI